MKENIKIAALLRGLSYKNNQSAIVTYQFETIVSDEKTIVLSKSENIEKAICQAVDLYVKENGQFPQAVQIEGNGSFLIGDNYDEANKTGLERKENLETVLTGKVSVVTGGAQGFGEGIVRSLADSGSLVFIADLNLEGAEKLAEEINRVKGFTTAFAISVNVCDEKSVEDMVEEIVTIAGGIDVFISNAGVLKAGSVKEMSLKDFNFVTSVDYTGYFICTKFVSRLMAYQNKFAKGNLSDIIQINSKSGLEGSNKNGAYAGAKFGGIGLTQSFALELIEDNIKVNSICPGNFLDGPLWSDPDRGLFVQYLNTGKVPGAKTLADVRAFYEAKVPMKRGCTTEDVMKAVTYIVDQRYETGQAVPVTGGQLMLK
ncbi:MAG: SDR family NAD(P)-dependent oxidoreductase [Spirochaetaceae bacterium]|jgi:sorbitol-6-phosphate 2-dehydrogenase|nr:SDR family NAD(P)-dependent oxidoreductase [Spirochaetaceae bacterium]